jgi:hypothetical protein
LPAEVRQGVVWLETATSQMGKCGEGLRGERNLYGGCNLRDRQLLSDRQFLLGKYLVHGRSLRAVDSMSKGVVPRLLLYRNFLNGSRNSGSQFRDQIRDI